VNNQKSQTDPFFTGLFVRTDYIPVSKRRGHRASKQGRPNMNECKGKKVAMANGAVHG
jgi:hypothetical protein